MKLEVGLYVRTKDGYICKILKLNEPFEDDGYLDHNDIGSASIKEENIIKTSFNLIDLIEVGDYVNGFKITYIQEIEEPHYLKRLLYFEEPEDYVIKSFDNEDIKSIVTKEQFEQISYKVGN